MVNKIMFALLLAATNASTALAASINYDFCTLPKSLVDTDSDVLWNAASVQLYTAQAAVADTVRDTPLAAYPTSYVAMTAARDKERCGGQLAISDRPSRLIGDLLADYMSRGLVSAVENCVDADADSQGLCGSLARGREARIGSFESALDMTAVYLSSHMATALVAVVYTDPFWEQEFPEATHCADYPCEPAVIRARVEYVKGYKKYYDLNNRFLADNLTTVATSLTDACLIKGPLIPSGARLAQLLPLELVFTLVRNETFDAALDALPLTAAATHPYLALRDGKLQSNHSKFKQWQIVPSSIARAEVNARRIFSNMLLTAGLRLVGSRTWDDIEANPPSAASGSTSDLYPCK